MYICTVFTHNTSTPRTDSPTSTKPTGYPTIQSNSDTNCLELASDPTGLRTQSHRIALTLDASCKYWVPKVLLIDSVTK